MGSSAEPLDYEKAGVNYDTLDAFKRACQKSAATTTGALTAAGLSEPHGIRGESAYLVETPNDYLAHVEEGLGTKNLVADEMQKLGRKGFYHAIGIDTVATIVNDLVTTGAMPVSVAMHAAVGDAAWFADTERAQALASGFAEGCRNAGAVWGGGETPALKGIVEPGAIVLAGSALGRIALKFNRIMGDVQAGGQLWCSYQWIDPLPRTRRPFAARLSDPAQQWPALWRSAFGSIRNLCEICLAGPARIRPPALCGSCNWARLAETDAP
jgi:phosphoribosylformylglycinamidine cyclo-ligase